MASGDVIRVRALVLVVFASAILACAPVTPPSPTAPAASAWPTVVRHEGEPCGGYSAPGEPLTTCAPGLRCDYGNMAVDAPGVCRAAR